MILSGTEGVLNLDTSVLDVGAPSSNTRVVSLVSISSLEYNGMLVSHPGVVAKSGFNVSKTSLLNPLFTLFIIN